MARTLLFTNAPAIAGDKKFINDLLPHLQNVASELTNLNVAFSIATIRELAFTVYGRRGGINEITEFVTNLIVEAVENPQIGNLPVSKDKLKSIIEAPDCSQLFELVKHLVNESYNKYRRATNLVYGNYFEVTNGIVSKLANIDTAIEEANSFYSENADQTEMFNKVRDFAAACNELENYMKSKGRNVDSFKNLNELEVITKEVDGVTGSDWAPSVTFIRNNFR